MTGKKVDVLDKGWIILEEVSGTDLDIINTARRSHKSISVSPEMDKRLLFHLMQQGHTTPFEFVEFWFDVHAPAVVWWQWVRHRTWSYLLSSGRYTTLDEFYVPTWDEKQKKKLTRHYKNCYTLYEEALEDGITKEQARLYLPGFAMYYTGRVKVDAHNLMHFMKLRLAKNAQYEIRCYATIIFHKFFKVALPWTAEAFEKYKI